MNFTGLSQGILAISPLIVDCLCVIIIFKNGRSVMTFSLLGRDLSGEHAWDIIHFICISFCHKSGFVDLLISLILSLNYLGEDLLFFNFENKLKIRQMTVLKVFFY